MVIEVLIIVDQLDQVGELDSNKTAIISAGLCTIEVGDVMSDWKNFINVHGNFELPNFLYRTINDLMKQTLDMGTLLSDDVYKLRAYKEQTKKIFRSKWFDLAQALEFFNIIEQCPCMSIKNYANKEAHCDMCKGARFVVNASLTPDEMKEVSIFLNAAQSVEVAEKVQKSLIKVLSEI